MSFRHCPAREQGHRHNLASDDLFSTLGNRFDDWFGCQHVHIMNMNTFSHRTRSSRARAVLAGI